MNVPDSTVVTVWDIHLSVHWCKVLLLVVLCTKKSVRRFDATTLGRGRGRVDGEGWIFEMK
jgi:hypothetical protein